ncbi:hypothetical protein Vadar_005653 [Vaccinium darrowii]|uniref:Uncharacterized protein n=1 Tax=Vaccinium darrowii TaxID=229202 RepID=A0ACB7XNW2_9ERIC|nr:hypothetical protein Vadar_005653 [Vaccinium darrowii]
MKVITLVLIIAITMALHETPTASSSPDELYPLHENTGMPSRTISRFLLDEIPTLTRIHPNTCHKDHAPCISIDRDGHHKISTCCHKRCVHIQTDRRNCGACNRMCPYRRVCCGGQCVDTAEDEEHCGRCHSRCGGGLSCIKSMCGYP